MGSEKDFFSRNMPDSSMTKTASVMSTNDTEKDKNTRIDLGDVTPHNIKLLKKVNQVVFPIVYHDKFYKDVLEAGELAKLAYYNDVVVGAVCCRIDNTAAEEGKPSKKKLYIMTLGCLAPYRRLGIGTHMLKHVMEIMTPLCYMFKLTMIRRYHFTKTLALKLWKLRRRITSGSNQQMLMYWRRKL